jgi:hypothetical protein
MAYPQFTENWDFSGNVEDDSNWDVWSNGTSTNLDADGDAIAAPIAENYKTYNAIYQTQTDSVDQAIKIEVKTYGDHDFYDNIRTIFRSTDADGTSNCYLMVVGPKDGSTVYLRVFTTTWNGSGFDFSQIGNDISITSPNNGDWLGFSVTGTGNDTVFKYWDFGGSDPGDFADWGAATQTITDNPGTAVDTGNYVGIGFYYSSGAYTCEIDTWVGGDQADSSTTVPPTTLPPTTLAPTTLTPTTLAPTTLAPTTLAPVIGGPLVDGKLVNNSILFNGRLIL